MKCINGYIGWNQMVAKLSCLWYQRFHLETLEQAREEEPAGTDAGGKEVIIEFVLMVVAVAVGYIFRDELKSLVSNLGTSVSSKITSMFNAT